MKFVIAPDKYKGSLSGFQFCDAVEEGLRMALMEVEIVKKPLADGGDGTIDVVKHYINGEKVFLEVNDPLFRKVKASYLYAPKNKIAYIEMAEASGLKLLKEAERNCMETSTFGTGELIADAIGRGAEEIILGIGGSATNDGGMGMAEALGYSFLDDNGEELKPIGKNLTAVKHIDATQANPKLSTVAFKVASDVTNPFFGPQGAAKIYAEQKGASQEEIEKLDEGLVNFARLILHKYGIDLQETPGSGAAGGIGGGAIAFLDAELTSGINLIMELANFDDAIKGANWIITGEGQLDEQTLSGKTIDGVISAAQKYTIPVAAFCGSVNLTVQLQKEFGLAYVTSILRGVSTLQQAMDTSYDNLVNASYNFGNVVGV